MKGNPNFVQEMENSNYFACSVSSEMSILFIGFMEGMFVFGNTKNSFSKN